MKIIKNYMNKLYKIMKKIKIKINNNNKKY